MHQIVSKMMFLYLAPPTGNGTFLRRSPPIMMTRKKRNHFYYSADDAFIAKPF